MRTSNSISLSVAAASSEEKLPYLLIGVLHVSSFSSD